MTLPNTTHAYQAEFDALDRALVSAKGIRIPFAYKSAAHTFRFRVNHARALDRKANTEVYEPGDPLYGRSAYDGLQCKLRQDTADEWWVYIEKNDVIPGPVEEIE